MTPFMALAAVYTLRDLSEARLVLRDDETGEVAIDPETGEPAISARHPFRPVVWGYLAVVRGAVRVVLAAARRRSRLTDVVLAAPHLDAAAGTDRPVSVRRAPARCARGEPPVPCPP